MNFQPVCKNNDVIWYAMEQQSRLVAKTGIPSDKFHLGKLILQGFEDAPDHIMQIDGKTGEILSFREAWGRSILCANAFRNLGLKQGDVVLLLASNNLNISIPYYASFYNGLTVSGLDWTFGVRELQNAFEILRPKIILCMSEKVQDIQQALKNMNLFCHIVTFDESYDVMSFNNLLKKHGGSGAVEEFKATEIIPEKTVAVVIPTSGTTNDPKAAAISHKALFFHAISYWTHGKQFPTPSRLALLSSPLQWLSAHMILVASPLLRISRLMYSQKTTSELLTEIINKYQPTYAILSPPLLALLLSAPKCDLTCFEQVLLGGSAVHKDFIRKFKLFSPNTQVLVGYGATECGISHVTELHDSLGHPTGFVHTRIVDVNTEKEIQEPHRNGELWAKGPCLFEGYVNNPKETKNAISKDGWFKTGDLFYKDENGNYHFVERIKLLLKYKNYQVSPAEIERVILKYPGVADVAVVGIPHNELGELASAFVVPKEGTKISAEDIKHIVKKNLAETKHLHGGVVFIEKLPLTISTKVHRRQLKSMAMTMVRE